MSSRWRAVARAGEADAGADAQADAGDHAGAYAEAYARRFAEHAAEGGDVHGEVELLRRLLPAHARVLDAGCGTGRVAVRLAELGHEVAGVDADESMVAVARRIAPALRWEVADLSSEDAVPSGTRGAWDAVVLAGNVVPLADPGTLGAVAATCAAALAEGGLLVAGFGLDDEHLPDGCPVTPLAAWDDAVAAAGLRVVRRYGAWDAGAALPVGVEPEGYVVTVHERRDAVDQGGTT